MFVFCQSIPFLIHRDYFAIMPDKREKEKAALQEMWHFPAILAKKMVGGVFQSSVIKEYIK